MRFEEIAVQYTTRSIVMRGSDPEIVLMDVKGCETGKTNNQKLWWQIYDYRKVLTTAFSYASQ